MGWVVEYTEPSASTPLNDHVPIGKGAGCTPGPF